MVLPNREGADRMIIDSDAAPATRPPFWRSLYAQVLVAIGLGILIGWMAPDIGAGLKGW